MESIWVSKGSEGGARGLNFLSRTLEVFACAERGNNRSNSFLLQNPRLLAVRFRKPRAANFGGHGREAMDGAMNISRTLLNS